MSLWPRRRTVLKVGGALALTSVVEGPLRMSAAAADTEGDERFTGPRQTRTFDVASSAAYSAYRLTVRGGSPSGKVSIAGIALGGAGFDTADSKVIADYRRALDPAVGMEHLSYDRAGHRILREAVVSKDADCLILRYRTEDPVGLTGTVSLMPGQDGAQVVATDNGLAFEGTMANNVRFACGVRIRSRGGRVGEGSFDGCEELTLYLDARTDYAMDAAAGWRGAAPGPVVQRTLDAAVENDSNQPAWGSDYHTNINIQMNYWAAETTNLSSSHRSLLDFVREVAIPSRTATKNAFGADVRGWTARTSQSPFGGNSWEWNTVASAWYMQHV